MFYCNFEQIYVFIVHLFKPICINIFLKEFANFMRFDLLRSSQNIIWNIV